MKEIHEGHPGIVKMKQIARNYVWWENIDRDLEGIARECLFNIKIIQPTGPAHAYFNTTQVNLSKYLE